ncbi:MAG: hypothetical protein HOY71_38675 [Nonomuraea sp.]|nr:hypothetical protein [Nonomuraea sp.]
MRLPSSRYAPLALFTAAILLAGCAEVNSGIDKAQACVQAPKIVADLGVEIAKLKDDPKAMDKAIDDASNKLNDVADKAANTTLKQATNDLVAELSKINVDSVNQAVDAIQKVGGETTDYLQKVAKACSS